MESIFLEIEKDFNSSVRVKIANSVLSESPKFKRLGHPTVETAGKQNINFPTSTRAKELKGLRRGTERDDRLGYTHDFETMSEMTAYHNHINDSEIETIEVFERETSSPENIQRTLPTDIMTRLYDNQLTRSMDSPKHEETHEPEVKQDAEPSLSDLSDTLSLDSRAKKKKSKKKKKRRSNKLSSFTFRIFNMITIVFEQETENIPLTRPTDLMNTLQDN